MLLPPGKRAVDLTDTKSLLQHGRESPEAKYSSRIKLNVRLGGKAAFAGYMEWRRPPHPWTVCAGH